MSVYLVTGGGGFIGSNIVDRLLADEHDVRVLDNFATGNRANLDAVADRIEVLDGDIRDADLVRRAVDGADYVLHQAALPSVARSVEDPEASNAVNVTGTLNVLMAARDAGVRRVVYASSSSVYGDTPTLPKVETMAPAPMSPYAVSKLAAEHYCGAFWHVYGLETVALRYFNVYGPRQDAASQYAAVIPIFIRAVLDGRRPRIFGDGEQSRDFTYVADVAEANVRAATAPGAAGAVCNLGCGTRNTLNELLAMIGRLAGSDVDAVYEEPRPGDVRHSQADTARAREAFGYDPQVSLEEGVRRTLEWQMEQA